MVVRRVFVAVWSVLAFLLLSKSAFAIQPSGQLYSLNHNDSYLLMTRMKLPETTVFYNGAQYRTKTFSTVDGAVKIECEQRLAFGRYFAPICSVVIDPSKAIKGITTLQQGYVANSITFRIQNKKDVTNILTNIVSTAQPFYSSEYVQTHNKNGSPLSVSRFSLECPRDWVFDVVECTGHIITR